jgi:hypothetical protein
MKQPFQMLELLDCHSLDNVELVNDLPLMVTT